LIVNNGQVKIIWNYFWYNFCHESDVKLLLLLKD